MRLVTDFTTLTFDCYGTLIDWESGILNELKPWASSHGIELSDDALLEAFGDAEARSERETPTRLYPQILENVLERLAARWSVTLRDGEARTFGESVGRWPAFPDSPAALRGCTIQNPELYGLTFMGGPEIYGFVTFIVNC